MPPRSPLPQRNGLDAAWVRTPDRDPRDPRPWNLMAEFLDAKLGEFISIDAFLAAGRFVYIDGSPVQREDLYDANTFIWFHRDIRDEPVVPGSIDIVYRDERIVVIDKPPFLSTIPRGRHITQSVVVRLRAKLGLPELTPAHRLDRMTSGLLLCTTERKWRGPYQQLFQQQTVEKRYLALAAHAPQLSLPTEVRNHLHKVHGEQRVRLVEDAAPNTHSTVTLHTPASEITQGQAVYELTPHTGKTHQLRQHMLSLGIPIEGDPLYPDVLPVEVDDFRVPLQLLAHRLEFTDPLDGSARRYEAARSFPVSAPAPRP